jgi:flagellar L-ring protein precursor FlgH
VPPLPPGPGQRPLYPPPGLPAPPPPPGVFIEGPYVHTVRDYSWHYIALPQPREIKEQDLITILVKEISEVSLDSRFDRQRRSTLLAELKEFIRIGKTGNLENAADNEPTIDANLSKRMNSNGRVSEKEEVVYRIAATVVDVLPNGNLVLEAQKEIQTNREIWKYTLTGTIRSQDINRDNTALSENIANLQIRKTQSGKVYDSTKRPWGTRLYDLLFPF